MKRKNVKSFLALVAICSLFFNSITTAATVITPATGGTCLNITPGAYKVLSNIFITEGAAGDFAVQAGTTFILRPPAGFEFRPGFGSVIFTAGRDISAATMVVTNTTITVTLTIPTNALIDQFRIRNVEVRSLVPYSIGNITRTLAGGTATITGDAPGAGVNHGSLTTTGTGAIFASVSNGNWSSGTTWAGGVAPSCNDNVVIAHAVTVDLAVGVNSVTINSGGNMIATNAVTIGGNFIMNGTAIYTHNNTVAASSTIFGGTENFASTSKIIVNNWSDYTVPLPTGVTGNFGAIDINTTGAWNHSGMFAPARIKGTLTINAGTTTMDDGTGMSTALTVQDVMVTGSGRFIAQSGTARNLTLVTNNYTDVSTNVGYSYIMFRSVGDLNWTINGNLTLNHRTMIVEGVLVTDVGSATINVTGNFIINGSTIYGMRNATGPFSMTVTGTTSISGTPALVSLKENYAGDVTFNSGTMTVSSGIGNYFQRGTNCVGTVTVNITGNLNITGNTTRLYISSAAINTSDVNLTVSADLNLTGGQLYTASTLGNVNMSVVGHYTQSGTTSSYFGQRATNATGNVGISVNGTLSVTNGTFTQSSGLGTIDLDVVETLSIQNAAFYGMANGAAGNNGSASLAVTDLDLSGSSFYLHRGEITDGRVITVDVTNQVIINFTNAAQQVFFISRASNNNAGLDLNVGSNFMTTGSANGLFCSSMSGGAETVDIGGDLSVAAGRVRFNAHEAVNARGHNVTGNITGSLVISGGSISLSTNRYVSNWNIGGDYDQTGGYAVYKWNSGASTINVTGNYTLSNGTVYMYSRSATPTPDQVLLTINGNASYQNATTYFDSCLTSTATHRIVFKGASVTYGANTVFNHISHLSNRTNFGNIVYDRAGTMTLSRSAASFDIQQVKQSITPGTTVDFSASPFDLMIASHMSSVSNTHTTLDINGTLNMGTRMIAGRNQAGYYASLNVNSGARIRTAHTNGLYSGTATNSTVYPMISGNLTMNYFLNANSTIEYNGTDTQIITGTGLGIATTTSHQYGILEINFQGTPDVEFAYPFDNNINVRTSLLLTTGELNLDNDHATSNGGRELKVLNGATVVRADGYLRSETDDGTAALNWNITTNGSFVIPFGYNSTEYIPFTYQSTIGSSGDVILATNHVAVDNTPLPPTVTHVRDLAGADNSNFTVDRFWRISVTGSVTASLTFSSTATERSGVINPRAQLWEPVTMGWFPPSGVQSNPTISTTTASGVTGLNNWWTLSSSTSPLPIHLVSFEASMTSNKKVALTWITASEINNNFFTVERSSNGENFTELVNVEGAGNSNSVNEYHEMDNAPLAGVNYYRLRQTDFDGTQTWSQIRTVNFEKELPVTVYPNPVVGNSVKITTDSNKSKITAVVIYDLAGKRISNIAHTETTDNSTEISLGTNLDQGIYMLEVTTSTGTYRERIIKQ